MANVELNFGPFEIKSTIHKGGEADSRDVVVGNRCGALDALNGSLFVGAGGWSRCPGFCKSNSRMGINQSKPLVMADVKPSTVPVGGCIEFEAVVDDLAC